jgi:hypothetical protein
MERRTNRGESCRLGDTDLTLIGKIAAVSLWESSRRDTANTGIVIVEMLLRVSIGLGG